MSNKVSVIYSPVCHQSFWQLYGDGEDCGPLTGQLFCTSSIGCIESWTAIQDHILTNLQLITTYPLQNVWGGWIRYCGILVKRTWHFYLPNCCHWQYRNLITLIASSSRRATKYQNKLKTSPLLNQYLDWTLRCNHSKNGLMKKLLNRHIPKSSLSFLDPLFHMACTRHERCRPPALISTYTEQVEITKTNYLMVCRVTGP